MVVDLRLVCRLLSPAVFCLGILALIPAVYSFISDTPGYMEFGGSAAGGVMVSILFRQIGVKSGSYTSLRELFLFTGALWGVMTLLAALPFYFILNDLSFPAAIFESASGLSTTGATVINELQTSPPAILLWRSILQFLGGIGFVVVAVAVLPNVAMGGMDLFKTESSSFDGAAKITPHIKTMAFTLMAWYLLTLMLCIFFYILGGFDAFLAVNAALCTVSTGGMMPIDASMNAATPFIHYTAIVFMFLGSCPFLLILVYISGSIFTILKYKQVLVFLWTVAALSVLVSLSLIIKNDYDPEHAFRVGTFNVVAILSSTGFNLEDFSDWNRFSSMLFLLILGIGGCSGSTAGGIKLFRLQICFSMFKTQIVKSIHPHAVVYPHFNRKIIDSQTLQSVITYLVAYALLAMISALIASTLGLSLADAVTGTISALSNIGPAMGPQLGPDHNFADLGNGLHLLFSADMILGRLEILPIVLCFTKMFWKR